MSTKIYTAFRCKPRTFSEVFLPKIRDHCFKKIITRVERLIGKVPESKIQEVYDSKQWKSEMSFDEFRNQRGQLIRLKEVFKRSLVASSGTVRDLDYDLDCTLSIWLYKNRFYIIPSGEHWIYEGFEKPEDVEDFRYYNNQEGPSNLTDRQWSNRGKTWNKVCLDNWNKGRMQHEIINVNNNQVGLDIIASHFLPADLRFAATINLK